MSMEQFVQTNLISFKAVMEAVLFAYGEPMPVAKLAEVLEIDKAALRQQLEELEQLSLIHI